MVMSLPPDFSEFLKLLNCHHVDYLLVGGFAVGFYGYPRATSDMDIWVSQSPENAGRVVAAVRIEVMNEIDGVTFEECQPAASHQYACACDGRATVVEAIVGDQ